MARNGGYFNMYGVIYKITNKLNGVEYIGQTIGSLKKRFNRHYNESSCPYINKALRKYGKENFKIDIIDECNSQKELNYREEYYIKVYDTLSPNGYNLSPGGDNGIKPSLLGRILTQEERNKISKTLKERCKDPIVIEKLRSSQSKMIKVICLQNGKVYRSVKEAARKLGLTKSKILDCIHGRCVSTKGYSFSIYDNEKKYEIKPMLESGALNKKKIIDQNGKIYPSIEEATKELKTYRECIRRVLAGKRKSHKGLTFLYVEVPYVI